MEENLEPNNKLTNEISDNATKSNSEEVKEPKSEVLDIKGNNSLTAGGSWWYGSSKTKASGAQYKPSNFYAIYVGFRCVFDN